MRKAKNAIIATVSAALAALTLAAFAFALTRINTYSARSGLHHASTGYWYGEFSSDDIRSYSNSFSDSKYAKFSVKGKSATITGKSGYYGNYKTLSIDLEGIDGAWHRTSPYQTGSSSQSFTRTVNYTGDIVSADYFAEIYDGTSSGSDFLDGYIISVS